MKSVVTLGTFDGVHRGHQKIIRRVVQRARALGATSVALSFGMPPRLGHRPKPLPVLLTTLQDKIQILKRLGIELVEVLIFNRRTAATPPERFFNRQIVKKFNAREMVVGPRVAFGKHRAGKLPLLKSLGRQAGVAIDVVGGVKLSGIPVSSSAIRAALCRGDVESARRQLGYPYSVAGPVIHGDHRGRKLGYPTANIGIDPRKILPPGVFWVKVLPGSEPMPFSGKLTGAVDGLCNIGTRPTFDPKSRRVHCEVFLFKTPSRLYGKRLRVVFLRRIRAEKRFNSPEALRRQIARDFAEARRWARRAA
jgi:riboflavin kinase/FMN adenylyltransferase